ncbi:hypothetical protein CULT_2330005 [[Clostridium] ultunense Esp]|nr:hypothetical protein CULT_2330005 [[Clostridium] ultunense Esp]
MNAVLEVLKEEKSMSQIASEYGVHVKQLRQCRDVALKNWPLVFEAKNRQIEELRSEYEQKIQALYAEVGKRSTQLAWVEKNLLCLRREERIALVDFKEREIPLTFQAKLISRGNQQHMIYPYLLRGLTIDPPNQVWGIDITYIRLKHGWMYLVAILDWFSRYVVSYEMAQTLHAPFVLEAITRALSKWKPEIINSDQEPPYEPEVH